MSFIADGIGPDGSCPVWFSEAMHGIIMVLRVKVKRSFVLSTTDKYYCGMQRLCGEWPGQVKKGGLRYYRG